MKISNLFNLAIGLTFSVFTMQSMAAEKAPKSIKETGGDINQYHFVSRHGVVKCQDSTEKTKKCSNDPVLNSCGKNYANNVLTQLGAVHFRSKNESWVKNTVKPAAKAVSKTVHQDSNVYDDLHRHLFSHIGPFPGSTYLWGMQRLKKDEDGINHIFEDLKNNSNYSVLSSCDNVDFSDSDTAYAYYLKIHQEWDQSGPLNKGYVHCECTGQKPKICAITKPLNDCK